ncbi:General transcription factor IIH subunit 1 [Smittium mucronatum]|uniref:General transcription factor IIH subunit 1 n=1 Tax=Smittium mucronatum TaxID=133383 RepID=A0A1R0H138_9FUNG|nr:General transcription factor IIH subunit 1 [Smittium mucronatum]
MWEEGESVQLNSETILFKKEGTLYCTNTRLAWVPLNSQKVAVSIPFSQIKSNFSPFPTTLIALLMIFPTFINLLDQQVSTQDASRVKLRLLVKPANPGADDVVYTFLWKDLDKDISRTERDSFKNSIAINMSRARQTPSAPQPGDVKVKNELPEPKKIKLTDSNVSEQDLKIRQLILSNNAELAHLHKNLVLTGIVPETEFWETRKHLVSEYYFQTSIQKGDESSWLEFSPVVMDNGNFKYTITPEIAKAIFKQYPQIKQAYIDNVPHKLPESVFWKRFLSSQFFNQNKVTSVRAGKDSIFDKLMDDEDLFLSTGKVIDLDNIIPLLDLTRTEQDHPETGNTKDITMQPGRNKDSLSLIRRFNRHSEMVLSETLNQKPRDANQMLEDSIKISDLMAHSERAGIPLNLENTSRYFLKPGEDLVINKKYSQNPAHVQFDETGGFGIAAECGNVQAAADESRGRECQNGTVPGETNRKAGGTEPGPAPILPSDIRPDD